MALRIELINALKRQLKSQGITYAALAQRLGLSEAAVKRMFSQGALSLVRLEEVCEVLQIGLAELAAEAKHGAAPPLAELDDAKERQLVEDPRLLLALYLTLNRWKEREVMEKYGFNKAEWTGLLVRLDRMGVIELLAENRYRLRTARNFRWRSDGPMERFFLAKLLPEYFKTPFTGEHERLLLLSGMVSRASAQRIQQALEQAASDFDGMLAQDASLPSGERIGLSLVLAQRPWQLRMYDGLRK